MAYVCCGGTPHNDPFAVETYPQAEAHYLLPYRSIVAIELCKLVGHFIGSFVTCVNNALTSEYQMCENALTSEYQMYEKCSNQ
jgi:hypothetical protein